MTFKIVGPLIKSGKEQVRELAECDAAVYSQMLISGIQVSEDKVIFKLKEGNDWFGLIGIVLTLIGMLLSLPSNQM